MKILSDAIDGWKNLSRAVKLITTVGAVFAAITATATGWVYVEPIAPAPNYYVRAHVDAKLTATELKWQVAQSENTRALHGLQIDNAERDCKEAVDAIIGGSIALPKIADETDRLRRAFQLEQTKRRYGDIDAKLRGWRGAGCPYSAGQ